MSYYCAEVCNVGLSLLPLLSYLSLSLLFFILNYGDRLDTNSLRVACCSVDPHQCPLRMVRLQGHPSVHQVLTSSHFPCNFRRIPRGWPRVYLLSCLSQV